MEGKEKGEGDVPPCAAKLSDGLIVMGSAICSFGTSGWSRLKLDRSFVFVLAVTAWTGLVDREGEVEVREEVPGVDDADVKTSPTPSGKTQMHNYA